MDGILCVMMVNFSTVICVYVTQQTLSIMTGQRPYHGSLRLCPVSADSLSHNFATHARTDT